MEMGAFLVLQLAAIVRVAAGLFSEAHYLQVVVASGILWMLAFGVFLTRYLPMLARPRIDGRPG
jgi:uncharacterized protein involved in response to NO